MTHQTKEDWMIEKGLLFSDYDNCVFCHGRKGGEKGNENVIDGFIVCDYCTIILHDMESFRKRKKEAAEH